MYNLDFQKQIERFRVYLWGAEEVDIRAAAEEAHKQGYVPPSNLELLPCHENDRGEAVPVLEKLEREIGAS